MSDSYNFQTLGRSALRWLAWFHRWAGIAFSLLFAVWFASGAVLTFVPFPALGEMDRLAGSERVDVAKIRTTPRAALMRGGGEGTLSLIGVAGRPVYLVSRPDAPIAAIAGDTGAPMPALSAHQAAIVAGAFAHAGVAAVTGPFEYDQWVVHNAFDPARPFYRVSLADPARTDLYVSARTGQVLQRTTASQRAWNWCGAVLHWIYFTPIRANWSFWDQLVWWVSLVGLTIVVAGIWLGFYRTLKLWSLGRNRLSPFRGWLRWHHIVGLFASVFVLVWMFSGWLSMDHGRLFSRGQATDAELSRFGGMSPAQIAGAFSLRDMARLPPAAQIDFGAVAGRPFIVARGKDEPAVFWANEIGRNAMATLPDRLLLTGIASAWPQAAWKARGPVSPDNMYALAEGMPAATRRFDQAGTALSLYVDPVVGQVVTVMNASRRSYAWAYYALHTFNFPGVSSHKLLRYVLILLPLTLGFVFSITGVVIGIQRLIREFHMARRS